MAGYAAALLTLGIMIGAVGLIYALHLAVTAHRNLLRAPPYLGGAAVAEHAFSRFHPRWYLVSSSPG
jgi:NADH-quinone oxidoreductase subunit A